jgi:hypothetical protein
LKDGRTCLVPVVNDQDWKLLEKCVERRRSDDRHTPNQK